MTTEVMRKKQFNIRLSQEEETRLNRVSAHWGVSPTSVLRMLLKREDDAIRERQQREKGAVGDERPSEYERARRAKTWIRTWIRRV